MRIIRTIVAALAIAALTAPAVHARPAEEPVSHARIADAPMSSPSRRQLDHNGEAAMSRRGRPARPSALSLRPRAIATTASRSAPTHSGPEVDWPLIALAVVGGLLMIGATAGIATRRRGRATA